MPPPIKPNDSRPFASHATRFGKSQPKSKAGVWKRFKGIILHGILRRTPFGYQLIASGADKRIIAKLPHTNKWLRERKLKLIYLPAQARKQRALKREFLKAQVIKRRVKSSKHLAVDMRPLDKSESPTPLFALEVERAKSDLEQFIQQGNLSMAQRLDICLQYACGLRDLHKAGFAQGDVKPENCLVYTQNEDASLGDGEFLIKLADFGKAKRIAEEGGSKMYKGNLRFCPPEGRLSKAGDVYGAALVMIRILEESQGILGANGSLPDISIPDKDRESETNKERGIAKFTVEHKAFLGIGKQGLYGGLTKRLPRQAKLEDLSARQRAEQNQLLNEYMDTLEHKLMKKEDISETDKLRLPHFFRLLKQMTANHPTERATAEEAYSGISQLISPELPRHRKLPARDKTYLDALFPLRAEKGRDV